MKLRKRVKVEQVQMFLSPVALSLLQAWLRVHPPAAVEEEEKQEDGSQNTGVTHPEVSTLKLSPSATGRYWQLLVAAPEKAV